MSQGYPSPFTGQQVDSAVSAYISGGITSAINTASGAAVTEAVDSATAYTNLASGGAVSTANAYTDEHTTLSAVVNSTDTTANIDILSGGAIYTYTQPLTAISAGSVISNSLGDIVHFSAAVAAITVNMPVGLTVLVWDDIAAGSAYDLMVCDNRVILKEVVSTTF